MLTANSLVETHLRLCDYEKFKVKSSSFALRALTSTQNKIVSPSILMEKNPPCKHV